MSEELHADLQLLREQATPSSDDGEATRLRVLRSLQTQKRAQARRRMVVLLAACFVGTIALAHYLPQQQAPAVPKVVPARTVQVTPHTAPFVEERVEVPVDSSPVLQAPPPATTAPRATHKTRVARKVALAADSKTDISVPDSEKTLLRQADAPPAPSLSPEAMSALYMAAHRLHFRGNPQAALDAWNRYLAAKPTGTMATEAHYNRAVTLLRVGRKDEARAELIPFARGDYGNFRKADARLLLKQLQ